MARIADSLPCRGVRVFRVDRSIFEPVVEATRLAIGPGARNDSSNASPCRNVAGNDSGVDLKTLWPMSQNATKS